VTALLATEMSENGDSQTTLSVPVPPAFPVTTSDGPRRVVALRQGQAGPDRFRGGNRELDLPVALPVRTSEPKSFRRFVSVKTSQKNGPEIEDRRMEEARPGTRTPSSIDTSGDAGLDEAAGREPLPDERSEQKGISCRPRRTPRPRSRSSRAAELASIGGQRAGRTASARVARRRGRTAAISAERPSRRRAGTTRSLRADRRPGTERRRSPPPRGAAFGSHRSSRACGRARSRRRGRSGPRGRSLPAEGSRRPEGRPVSSRGARPPGHRGAP